MFCGTQCLRDNELEFYDSVTTLGPIIFQSIRNYVVIIDILLRTVEGCADPDLPERMWMKRDALEALVGCKADMQMSWILKCVLGKWEGQVGICSSSGASVPTAISSSLPGPLSGPPVAPSIYQKGKNTIKQTFFSPIYSTTLQ